MIDFSKVQVLRMKDKASPLTARWDDCFRSWWILRNKQIKAGESVIFKKRVSVVICKTGKLTIADHCVFNEYSEILLTMPHPTVTIGKWVNVGRNTSIACKNKIVIGDYTQISPNCYLIDHEHGFSKDDIILNQRAVLKEIIIGRDCYFGTGTMVLGDVRIGDGAVVAAGSLVTRDIPPYQVWGGVPARYIRDRA